MSGMIKEEVNEAFTLILDRLQKMNNRFGIGCTYSSVDMLDLKALDYIRNKLGKLFEEFKYRPEMSVQLQKACTQAEIVAELVSKYNARLHSILSHNDKYGDGEITAEKAFLKYHRGHMLLLQDHVQLWYEYVLDFYNLMVEPGEFLRFKY